MTDRINTNVVSDEDLQDWFAEAFEEQVGSMEIEPKSERSPGQPIRMEVMVSGMAGDPTVDDFKAGNVPNAERILVEQDGRGSLEFRLLLDETTNLNTNDYQIVYQSID